MENRRLEPKSIGPVQAKVLLSCLARSVDYSRREHWGLKKAALSLHSKGFLDRVGHHGFRMSSPGFDWAAAHLEELEGKAKQGR